MVGMISPTSVRGWHFCCERDGHPVLRDGTPCPTTGAIEVFDGGPVMCKRGLHWSERAIDALSFAPGPWVRLVEGEPTETHSDKVVGRTRRTVAGPVNADRTLRGFGALCALRALRRYADPNMRDACMPMVRCTLQYWRSGQWPETIHAARAAARYAAQAAAWDAASDAAAWDAASDAAAWDAASDAAQAAAWAAGLDAAAWDAASDAAQAAALGAAWAAERDWQNRVLEAMLRKALEVRQ